VMDPKRGFALIEGELHTMWRVSLQTQQVIALD
jgi:hypothetical protein